MAKYERGVRVLGDRLARVVPRTPQALSHAVFGRAVRAGMTRRAAWFACVFLSLFVCFGSSLALAQAPSEPSPTSPLATQDLQIADPALRQALAPLLAKNRQLELQLRAQQDSLAKLTAQLGQSETLLGETALQVNQRDQEVESLRRQATALTTNVAKQDQRLVGVENFTTNNTVHIDRFWLLIAAALVFLMQAGFKCLEVGMVRTQHGNTTAIKNLLDYLVISIVFFLFGFGFMFGDSLGGFLGGSLFAPTLETMESANPKFGLEFFLFQLVFAGTACTIVSGAMAERTALVPYLIIALFVGGLVYPVIGHWCWGAEFYSDPQNGVATGWLKQLGFVDFAGSTVVHCVGAWVAFWGIRQVGARRGRFFEDGTPNDEAFPPYSLGYATLGVLLLWFGWWGFNGGSQLRYDLEVSSIVLNTNIGAAAAGLVAFAHATIFDRERSYLKLLGGVLGGLVAVTANCNQITSLEAVVIGAVAGLLHNFAFDWLLKRKLDDPVGAIPVHGACGVWGTLAVALFGDKLTMPWTQQLGVQALGIVVVFLVVSAASYGFFLLLNQLGMRVTAYEERHGFTVGSRERSLPAVRAPELTRVVWTADK